MATDRPGGPDNPDRPTPDPARPSEPPTPPSESAASGESGHPAEPTEPAATPESPDESGSAASGPTPTLRLPAEELHGGNQPTLPLPGAAATPPSAGEHPPADESRSGAGAFGPAGVAPVGAVTPPPGVEPPFTLPMPSLEPDAPPVPAVPEPPRRGSIITQQAGITQPRPPTVAEVRAREKARKRAEEQQQAEAEAAEAKQRKKKRILIGGAAVAGIAALVGGGYLVASAWSGPDVTASCTVVADKGEIVPIGNGQTVTADRDNQEIVVPDNYCSSATSGGHPGTHTSTFIYLGHSYRYYYGGNTTIGHAPTGGTTVAPKGATVKTKSGSTIQRGGLGAKIGGGS
ncbi:hypothetical protein ACWELJ_05830 [Nocardia sp. NPDC004582]